MEGGFVLSDEIFCSGGGCAAKLGAGALAKVLSKLEKKPDPNLLVGFEGNDDAAVYQIDEDKAVVSTLDFFPALVKDPEIFGRIAAANAMSDIFAMGADVICALNIVCFPQTGDLNILGKILKGGNDKVIEAGGTLAGGHSIHDTEIKYGLSVTGIIDPKLVKRNNTPKAGDILYLTKPLGTGITLCSDNVGDADPRGYAQALASMQKLNKTSSQIGRKYASSMTDITGFGLAVHAGEMFAKNAKAIIDLEKLPLFVGVTRAVEEFYITAAGQRNRNGAEGKVEFETGDYISEEIVFDPQTSGGLLLAVAQKDAEAFEVEMQQANEPFWQVGIAVERKENDPICVRFLHTVSKENEIETFE
jgi:selenide,water dikinase